MAFQTKRAEPQKRSSDTNDNSGYYSLQNLIQEILDDVHRYRTMLREIFFGEMLFIHF